MLYVFNNSITHTIQQIYLPHKTNTTYFVAVAHRMKYSSEQDFYDWQYTYNTGLNYRAINTTYSVGDIVYFLDLPTNWFLECTKAGTTGSSLTINNLEVNTEITDGTVKWKIRQTASTQGLDGFVDNRLATSFGSLYRVGGDTASIAIISGNSEDDSPYIRLYGVNHPETAQQGAFFIGAKDSNGNGVSLVGRPNKALRWAGGSLADSTVIAKSLSTKRIY